MLKQITRLGLSAVRRMFSHDHAARVRMRNAPLDLRIVGRVLVHAALVGLAAGAAGAAFFALAELAQVGLLETMAGLHPLRAVGETFPARFVSDDVVFRPWVLLFLPALGAGLAGPLCWLAAETRGGGGD